MKYILMCVGALLVCLVCAWVPAILIGKKKSLKKPVTVLIGFGLTLLLVFIIMAGYLSIYYHADESASVTSDTVQMEEIDGGFLFDGPGEEKALIFYPGAKVETTAYAPLMTKIAEQGVDCFLADMPFRMAMFGGNIAEKFQNAYTYETWAAAGHSMGGLVISSYAVDHADSIDCLILLAAYPGGKLPDDMEMLSVYGSNDGCLNREVYETSREYWPAEASEYVLTGGNHANYGNYGEQDGDMEAEISREEQQKLTAEKIVELVKNCE